MQNVKVRPLYCAVIFHIKNATDFKVADTATSCQALYCLSIVQYRAWQLVAVSATLKS